jgi:hypothetical protein
MFNLLKIQYIPWQNVVLWKPSLHISKVKTSAKVLVYVGEHRFVTTALEAHTSLHIELPDLLISPQ